MFHGRLNATVSGAAFQVPELARPDGLGGQWDGCHAGSSPPFASQSTHWEKDELGRWNRRMKCPRQ